MKKYKGKRLGMQFEQGGTFGASLMSVDSMPNRFDNGDNTGHVYTGASEERKENRFLSMAHELGRPITPADEERIWAEIEANS